MIKRIRVTSAQVDIMLALHESPGISPNAAAEDLGALVRNKLITGTVVRGEGRPSVQYSLTDTGEKVLAFTAFRSELMQRNRDAIRRVEQEDL